MTKFDKLLSKVLRGTSDHNFSFTDLCQLLKGLNFQERIKGDHHIFVKTRITQVFRYLIYQDFNKCAHLRSVVINQSVIEAPQDLRITLTAPAWERDKLPALPRVGVVE